MRPIDPDGGPVREHEAGLRVRPEATHPVHAGQHGNRADIQLNIYLVVSACSEQDAVLVCRAMPERWACCPLTPPFRYTYRCRLLTTFAERIRLLGHQHELLPASFTERIYGSALWGSA